MPVRVVFVPRSQRALVVSDSDSTVFAFDVQTRTQTHKLNVPRGPKVIAVSADGRRAYISHPERGALTMIDIPAMVVLRTVLLPGTPDGVAIIERRPYR